MNNRITRKIRIKKYIIVGLVILRLRRQTFSLSFSRRGPGKPGERVKRILQVYCYINVVSVTNCPVNLTSKLLAGTPTDAKYMQTLPL